MAFSDKRKAFETEHGLHGQYQELAGQQRQASCHATRLSVRGEQRHD